MADIDFIRADALTARQPSLAEAAAILRSLDLSDDGCAAYDAWTLRLAARRDFSADARRIHDRLMRRVAALQEQAQYEMHSDDVRRACSRALRQIGAAAQALAWTIPPTEAERLAGERSEVV